MIKSKKLCTFIISDVTNFHFQITNLTFQIIKVYFYVNQKTSIVSIEYLGLLKLETIDVFPPLVCNPAMIVYIHYN